MGGSAFSSGPDALCTPRMAPPVYRAARARCHAALRSLYECVATPIEGPARPDHGDLDILVALDRRGAAPAAGAWERIRDALAAERLLVRGARTASLAVPWPADAQAADGAAPRRQHVQVDVHICAGVAQLQWLLFKHAHGDLWSMLGTVIRPLGLTADEEALWLRVPDIERFHRSRSKVRLTDDPATVLAFLGLDPGGAAWEGPFGSAEELYEYVATCSWFWVAVLEDGDGQGGEQAAAGAASTLNSNDHRRKRSRPVFRAWAESFLPRCRADGRFPPPVRTTTLADARRLVREEAFARFPGSEGEYAARLRGWVAERQRDEIQRDVIGRGVQPREGSHPAYRACAVRALRRILIPSQQGGKEEEEGFLGFVLDKPVRNSDGTYDVAAAREFVRARWEDVAEAAWGAQLARARGRVAQG